MSDRLAVVHLEACAARSGPREFSRLILLRFAVE